jgi:hypothetical protein
MIVCSSERENRKLQEQIHFWHKLPKLSQKEMENLNSLISIISTCN